MANGRPHQFILFLFTATCCLFPVFAQTTTPTPQPNSVTQAIGVSESVPYKPRQLPTQKKSKDKKNSDGDQRTVPKTEVEDSLGQRAALTFPVSVLGSDDKGLQGLSKDNFRVFIGDEEQSITSVETGKPLNIVLLLDLSPSTDFQLKQIKSIATQLVETLGPDDTVMVAQFSEDMKVLCDFTTDRKEALRSIEQASIGDGTSLYDSVTSLLHRKMPVNGSTSIILFSDGVDTTSKTADYAQSLVEAEKTVARIFPIFFDTTKDLSQKTIIMSGSGNKIYTATLKGQRVIGLGPVTPDTLKEDRRQGMWYLDDLSRLSGGREPFFEKVKDSLKVSETVTGWLKSEYLITIKPSITNKVDARLPLRVIVNKPTLTVLAKGSYLTY